MDMNLGFAKAAIEVYYVALMFIKGLGRTGFFLFFFIDSFFYPHQCCFAVGLESFDQSHVSFLSVVMRQVRADQMGKQNVLNALVRKREKTRNRRGRVRAASSESSRSGLQAPTSLSQSGQPAAEANKKVQASAADLSPSDSPDSDREEETNPKLMSAAKRAWRDGQVGRLNA